MITIELKEFQPHDLNGIYKDIAKHLGIEVAAMIFEQYKGLQITFPVRLLSKEFVKGKVIAEYNGKNIRQLARKYGYSERWIRKLIFE